MSKAAVLKEQLSLFDMAYEQGNPLISDTEYEKKYNELKKLEEKHGVSADSPTQVIPFSRVKGLEVVKHPKPMLSLNKVNNFVDLRKWFVPGQQILIQPKLDGLTVVLKYENGELADAVLRGDGYEGERILHIVRTIQSLPQRISYQEKLEARGEIYIPFKVFEEINNGEYANPRSMAAGTVRLLDANIAAKRKLDIKIFDLVSSNEEFTTDFEQLMFLFNIGLPVVDTKVKENLEKIISYCSHYEREIRKTLPYPIDGLVLKVNDLAIREKMGETSKTPKWAIAFKFESEEEFTTLKYVQWQVGKTGQVTPVAIFDPIKIDGVIITKATLHNFGFIQEQNLKLGSRIVVARANDVIPKVVKAVSEGTAEITLPKNCPICGAAVKLNGANAYCTGTECPGQLKEKLIHFCSRDAMDIKGMGEETVKTLFNLRYIKTPADLYTLHQKADQIKMLDGYGDKKVRAMLDGIEESKNQPFQKVLYAINVPYLGRTNAKTLVKEFRNIDSLMAASAERLKEVEGIGNITAETIAEFFKDENNIKLINELKTHGLCFASEEPQESSEVALKDMVFVISGTLSKPRQFFEDAIVANGGKATGSVSKKTNYLILGPDKSGTAKHKQAEKLGIPIINEETFWQLVGGRVE